MNIEYKFIHKVINKQKVLEIILPEKHKILKQFLECEIQQNPYKTYIINEIDNVLNKKRIFYLYRGNMFELHIHRRKTIVINYIMAYECEPVVYDNETIYFISTQELKEILKSWLNEVQKFNNINP